MFKQTKLFFYNNCLTTDVNGEFLKHIHYFRGFAIINIVFVHIMQCYGIQENLLPLSGINYLYTVREVLFHDSTIYFLFISGFLLFHCSSNFRVSKYYRSKLKNIIFPYIIISTSILVLFYINSGENVVELSKIWLKNIIFGRSQLPFWYIPFIAIVYLISPLFFIIPNKIRHYAMPIILILPLLGTRTGTRVTIYQFLYFVPVYIIGMYSAMNYDNIVEFTRKKIYLFITTAITSTVIISLFFVFGWKSHYGVLDIKEGLFYIQKISLTVIVLKILKSFKNNDLRMLDLLAIYSFGIFFTHYFLDSYIFAKIKISILEYVANNSSVKLLPPLLIIYSIILVLINVFFIHIIRKVLKKTSRVINGV